MTSLSRLLRSTVAALTVAVTATTTLGAAPATAAELGPAPDIHDVHHLQRGSTQVLRWEPVAGATAYQVFAKSAHYRRPLPREWRLVRTVEAPRHRIVVGAGKTRQFGVRAVGDAVGTHKAVTAISSFGTISRPAPLTELTQSGTWQEVARERFYRGAALVTRQRGARLELPGARQTSAVRLIAETGPFLGVVDVLVDGELVERVNFGGRRRDADRDFHLRVPRTQSGDGTITVVSRSRKPVRISAVGHVRRQTEARLVPEAPVADPAARSFTVTGAGWGHGVGLSQYGAMEMAEDGRSARQILRHYYPGTDVTQRADNRLIGVNVGYQLGTVQARLRALEAGATARVCAIRSGKCDSDSVIEVRDATADSGTAGLVTITRNEQGKVRARVSEHGADPRTIAGDRIRVRWSGTRYLRGAAGVVRLQNGREYRHGQLTVSPMWSRSLNAVLTLRLQDEYLRGVAEVPSSWHSAALRTQAIIARTYALKTGAGAKSDCACNLRDSVVHQAYSGWSKESEGWDQQYGKRWVDAVNATAQDVVEYAGELAGTFYYSSSGGHTLNSQDVWSAEIPYLQSVDDPWSLRASNPNRAWTQTFTQAQMASILGVSDLRDVEVTGRYEGGAVREITGTTAEGRTVTISGKADELRHRLGLKSSFIRSITETY